MDTSKIVRTLIVCVTTFAIAFFVIRGWIFVEMHKIIMDAAIRGNIQCSMDREFSVNCSSAK